MSLMSSLKFEAE